MSLIEVLVLERDLATELPREPLPLEMKCSSPILLSYCQCAYVFDVPELLGELSSCISLSRLL